MKPTLAGKSFFFSVTRRSSPFALSRGKTVQGIEMPREITKTKREKTEKPYTVKARPTFATSVLICTRSPSGVQILFSKILLFLSFRL
jgi:hypothetical protein